MTNITIKSIICNHNFKTIKNDINLYSLIPNYEAKPYTCNNKLQICCTIIVLSLRIYQNALLKI